MKIAFVIPKFKFGVIQFPIGELNTATILKQLGHDATIIDLRISRISEFADDLSNSDIILLSTSTYDFTQCYSLDAIGLAASTISKIRSFTNKKIYLLGAHGTVLPNSTLKDTHADGVIRGEFERNAIDFILNKQKRCKIFPPININPARFDINSIVADYSLIRTDKYSGDIIENGNISKGKCALILGNRGCPYKCAFCYNFFGKFRLRRYDLVMQELSKLYYDYGFKNYFFLDYTFTANQAWVLELCRSIYKSGIKLGWICQTRCDTTSLKTIKAMKKAGCTGIWFGVENPFVLNSNKYSSLAKIEKAISGALSIGIVPIIFLQLMLPFEKRDDIYRLAEWVTSMQTHFAFSLFLPRPYTKLFSVLAADLKIKKDWASIDDVIERNFKTLESLEIYDAISNRLRKSKWFIK
jgi:radical SAM superfamily enzyme YgiQ (UPF0313 family)